MHLLESSLTSLSLARIWFKKRRFQLARQGEAVSQPRSEYRQENFETLYSEVDRLTEELNQLKSNILPSQTD